MSKLSVLNEIALERQRQDNKWGVQNHPSFDWRNEHDTFSDRCLYNMENARLSCDYEHQHGHGDWRGILKEEYYEAMYEAACHNEPKLRTELIQCAAVIVAWIECIDRRNGSD